MFSVSNISNYKLLIGHEQDFYEVAVNIIRLCFVCWDKDGVCDKQEKFEANFKAVGDCSLKTGHGTKLMQFWFQLLAFFIIISKKICAPTH